MPDATPILPPSCLSCGHVLGYVAKGLGLLKIPVRSRFVVVRLDDGEAEMNCPKCGNVVGLNLRAHARVP